ncbi:hypothetical protein BH23PLA1_BH23PLA1_36820 [soil metagenome]
MARTMTLTEIRRGGRVPFDSCPDPTRMAPPRSGERMRTMLVLTRKLMEKLYIGDDITVTVVRMEGSQVRLGIEAPRHIPVVRAELDRRDSRAKPPPSPVPEVSAVEEPAVTHERSRACYSAPAAPAKEVHQRQGRDDGPVQGSTRSDSRNR